MIYELYHTPILDFFTPATATATINMITRLPVDAYVFYYNYDYYG